MGSDSSQTAVRRCRRGATERMRDSRRPGQHSELAASLDQNVLRKSRDVRRSDNRGPVEDVHLRMKVRHGMYLDVALDQRHDLSWVDLTGANGARTELRHGDVAAS